MTAHKHVKLPVLLLCIGALFYSCKTGPAAPEKKIPAPEQAKNAETPFDFAQALNTLLEQGDTAGALELFNSIPEKLKDDRDLQILRVSLLISAERLDEASTLINSLKSAMPKDADILYLEAVLARANGNKKQYETSLNTVLKLDPSHIAALSEMGQLMYSQKKWNQASGYFTKSLKVNPDDPIALYGLARVQYRSEKFDEAEKTLDATLKVDPYNPLVWADRAKVKFASGKYEAAITDIMQAITLQPDDSYYWYDLGRFQLKLKRRAEALEAFSKSIECNPDYFLSYVYRAGMRDEDGDYTGAIQDYYAIVRLKPEYYFANEALGVLLWKQKKWSESRQNFAVALSYRTTNVSYALMYCACLQRENQRKEINEFLKGILPAHDRNSLEYSIFRLYNDYTGDNEVLLQLQKEKSVDKKTKALFYLAAFYEGAGKDSLAQKIYLEAKSVMIQPAFFEARMIDWAVEALNLPL